MIRFLSFNIRSARSSDGDHAWDKRRGAAAGIVRDAGAAVVGVQEALRRQLRDLRAALPGYRSVSVCRRRFGFDEHVALLLRKDVDVLFDGAFWLSETPSRPGSRGWDAMLPRVCQWAVLRHDGTEFVALNTHFDHRGKEAVVRSAALVAERLATFGSRPRVLLGDLNATPESEPLRHLEGAGMRDTLAGETGGTLQRFGALSDGPRIDYVLCDARWTVHEAGIVREPIASDHYPVAALLSPRRS